VANTVTHHELCFGCGIANLFGLQLELEPAGGDGNRAAGRFFVKQDHQGPPGFAHGGVIASALDEAMALLVHAEGIHALTRRLEVDFLGPVPIGTFAAVAAWVESREGDGLALRAELRGADGDERPLARATGLFTRIR
jgi:acyl-coenzyme A thioesterase PaaI-like protein